MAFTFGYSLGIILLQGSLIVRACCSCNPIQVKIILFASLAMLTKKVSVTNLLWTRWPTFWPSRSTYFKMSEGHFNTKYILQLLWQWRTWILYHIKRNSSSGPGGHRAECPQATIIYWIGFQNVYKTTNHCCCLLTLLLFYSKSDSVWCLLYFGKIIWLPS